MNGDYNQSIKQEFFLKSNPNLSKLQILKADCQEHFTVSSRHGATPQRRPLNALITTTRPPHLGIIRC